MIAHTHHRLSGVGWTLVVAVYIVVAAIVSYPLVRHLGTALAGIPADAGVHLWCMDTFWTNLRAGENPFFTNRIFYPIGTNLAHSSCVPVLSLFALPFLSHLILYGGLITLLSFVVAALGMALLVRTLTADDGAAAVAGLLYGFNPVLLSLVWVSIFVQLASAAFLPFAVLFFVRFMRSAGLRPLLGLSAVAWMIALTHVYTAAAFIVTMVVLGVVMMPGRMTREHAGWALLAGAGNLAVLWILLRFVFPPLDASDIPRGGYGFTSASVVNLADLLVPSARNPLLGWLNGKWATDGNNGDLNSYFLGWGILTLAVGAVVCRCRDREVVALAAAGAAVLLVACGTAIRVGGTILLTHEWTPFEWLSRLPFFELLDSPRRLVVGVPVAVTALAGVGLAMLAASTGCRRTVLVFGVALFALEYGQLGSPVHEIPVPAIYERLAAEPAPRTVLELGGGLAASANAFGLDWSTPSPFLMYWQTIHRKPRVGGYIARIARSTDAWFRAQPVLSDLFTMTHAAAGQWSGRRFSPEEVEKFIDTFNLGYVVIPPYPRHAEYAAVIEELLAGRIARSERDEAGYVFYVLVAAHEPPR